MLRSILKCKRGSRLMAVALLTVGLLTGSTVLAKEDSEGDHENQQAQAIAAADGGAYQAPGNSWEHRWGKKKDEGEKKGKKHVLENSGLLSEQMGDWFGAFQQYQQAAQIDPTDLRMMEKLFKAYRKAMEKLAKAQEKVYEKVYGKHEVNGDNNDESVDGHVYGKDQEKASVVSRVYGALEMDDIPVFVNGRQVIFNDVPPQVRAGHTLVPVRKLAESLGATVTWDQTTGTVTIATPAGTTVRMTIGSTAATVNGTQVTLDVAPTIVAGRTLFPARFVAEALGYRVGWNDLYRVVTVTLPAPAGGGTAGSGGTTSGGTATGTGATQP